MESKTIGGSTKLSALANISDYQRRYLETLKERVRAKHPHLYPVRSVSPAEMAKLANVTIYERFDFYQYAKVLAARHESRFLDNA